MACEDKKKGINKMTKTDSISSEEWKLLAQRRIVFGHQSVGNNILSGVKELAKQAGVSLSITETRNAATNPGISHFKIGQNDDPYSKTKDFESTMDSGAVKDADIALMKLCYIDFNNRTDAIKLANDYCESIDRLSKKFPNTVFVAVTTPLSTVQSGPKAWVKRLLGRTPSGYVENARRKDFNDYLRNRYGKSSRIFDLAKYENNDAGAFAYRERPIEVLNSSITDDGGHLNARGQQYISTGLIKFLASVPLSKINN
jgi:hypothetical protein